MANRRNGLAVFAALAGLALTAAATAQEINITDQEGREITLDGPAERIVTIPMPMASSVIAIDGSTEHLVGMNPVSKAAVMEGILGKIFPESQNINDKVTAANFVPNVEELAAVNPDLVIQWGGRGADLVDPITNAGLNAMLILYGTEERTRGYMGMTATALGKTEKHEAHIAWRQQVQDAIAAKASGIAEADKPKVLYFQRILTDMTVAGSGNNYMNWQIELTGGVNAAAELDGAKPVNAEQVAAWNPDIILLDNFEPGLTVERIYSDPILSLTNAAQNKQVYRLPLGGYRWDPPNQESPLTWMWLANITHPGLFEYDLRAEMKSAYETIYDYQLSDADIDGILFMEMQGDAANYAQFQAN